MKALIVDSRIDSKCERALLREGFYLFKLPPDLSLGEAVRSHPDTLLFFADNEIITTVDYCDSAAYVFTDIREYFPKIKLIFSDESRSSKYPLDCIMNALKINEKIFCKADSISEAILDFARRNEYEIISTRQGYPACAVLKFEKNTITADRGMAKILSDNGINVCLIESGSILLPPHEYGFIGGASFVYNDKVYFFGDLMSHPDGKLIEKFIKDAGFIPISLSDEKLVDFGGAFVLE